MLYPFPPSINKQQKHWFSIEFVRYLGGSKSRVHCANGILSSLMWACHWFAQNGDVPGPPKSDVSMLRHGENDDKPWDHSPKNFWTNPHGC